MALYVAASFLTASFFAASFLAAPLRGVPAPLAAASILASSSESAVADQTNAKTGVSSHRPEIRCVSESMRRKEEKMRTPSLCRALNVKSADVGRCRRCRGIDRETRSVVCRGVVSRGVISRGVVLRGVVSRGAAQRGLGAAIARSCHLWTCPSTDQKRANSGVSPHRPEIS